MDPHAKKFKTKRSAVARQGWARVRSVPRRNFRTRVTGGAPRIVAVNET
jgi:hypothetical protein